MAVEHRTAVIFSRAVYLRDQKGRCIKQLEALCFFAHFCGRPWQYHRPAGLRPPRDRLYECWHRQPANRYFQRSRHVRYNRGDRAAVFVLGAEAEGGNGT